jgi:hypothetical protein
MTLYLLALVSLLCENPGCVTKNLHLGSPASMSIHEPCAAKRKAREAYNVFVVDQVSDFLTACVDECRVA